MNPLKKRQSVNYFCIDSSHYSADLSKHKIASGFNKYYRLAAFSELRW